MIIVFYNLEIHWFRDIYLFINIALKHKNTVCFSNGKRPLKGKSAFEKMQVRAIINLKCINFVHTGLVREWASITNRGC